MSLPDTAEYWHDVKKHHTYNGPYFVHIPDSPCGHFKPGTNNSESSQWLNDISCHACKKLIKKNENVYGLKVGVSPAQQSLADREKFKFRFGRCPKCGGFLVERINKKTKNKFYGCVNYPRCKHTQN